MSRKKATKKKATRKKTTRAGIRSASSQTTRKERSKRSGVIAKKDVLDRFASQQLADLERRVSADIDPDELREMIAAADAAYYRVRKIDHLLRELKRLREERGLTQAQVDAISGIGRANISRLENLHLSQPSLETILRYAQAIGVDLYIGLRPQDAA